MSVPTGLDWAVAEGGDFVGPWFRKDVIRWTVRGLAERIQQLPDDRQAQLITELTNKQTVTAADVAEILDMDPQTLRRWCRDGEFTAAKIACESILEALRNAYDHRPRESTRTAATDRYRAAWPKLTDAEDLGAGLDGWTEEHDARWFLAMDQWAESVLRDDNLPKSGKIELLAGYVDIGVLKSAKSLRADLSCI